MLRRQEGSLAPGCGPCTRAGRGNAGQLRPPFVPLYWMASSGRGACTMARRAVPAGIGAAYAPVGVLLGGCGRHSFRSTGRRRVVGTYGPRPDGQSRPICCVWGLYLHHWGQFWGVVAAIRSAGRSARVVSRSRVPWWRVCRFSEAGLGRVVAVLVWCWSGVGWLRSARVRPSPPESA